MAREVEYCGRCDRQCSPPRCPVCGKLTVTCNTDRETAAEVRRKWQRLYGNS